jgi:beta-lactamase class A
MSTAPTSSGTDSPDVQASLNRLTTRLGALERDSGARALAVCVHDTESGASLEYHADRWFHAASTIKLAILLGVYSAIHHRQVLPEGRLHVRNRFYSAADGRPFRVAADRDANPEVHAAIGRMMRVSELAHHMIVTSSNLATNLLLDLTGVATVQRALETLGLEGIDLRRGVEDDRAFMAGMNNRVTARGLVALLRTIAQERAFSPELSREMLDILHAQEFRHGIPARLPSVVRVAHKTGEISTVAHDAGAIYPPARRPYVLAVLTEWESTAGTRSHTIADASHMVYDALTGGDGDV